MREKPSCDQQQTYAQQLMEACRCGSNEDVSKLAKAVADISAEYEEGGTLLTIACERGNESVVKQLTEAIKVHELMEACRNGDIIDSQLITRVDINARNQALMIACSNGHKGVFRKLIKAGADVNAKNKHGETALMEAISHGHEEVVDSLIASRADVNASNGLDVLRLSRIALFKAMHKARKVNCRRKFHSVGLPKNSNQAKTN